MLPVPILDDQLFIEIVAEARKMIPRFYSDWTDENYHDPGITMIELLAWLSEMQQYYLDRVTEKNERKFLKLMGIRPLDAISARTEVTFSALQESEWIPCGIQLGAGDQVFESDEAIYLLPITIEKMLVYADGEYGDVSALDATPGLSYYAFGRQARSGNRLLLGMDRPIPGTREISLNIKMDDNYPIAPGEVYPGCQVYPSAANSWYYYGKEGDSIGWHPLLVTVDDSRSLHCSGKLRFVIPDEMMATRFNPALDKDRYWICCVLEGDEYELPPRIEKICLNTLTATQQTSHSIEQHFAGSGQRDQRLVMQHALSYYGKNEVQVRNDNGDWAIWQKVDELVPAYVGQPVYVLKANPESRTAVITFGNGDNGAIPGAGVDNVRVLSFSSDFEGYRWLGCSNGLPGQSFELPWPEIIKDSFRLQTGVFDGGSGEWRWQDWCAVDDFSTSGPADRHYVIDQENQMLYFGDNERGMVPPASETPNILIAACKTGGGERGNVKAGDINRILEPDLVLSMISITNLWPARGGAPAENLNEAKARLRRVRNTPQRAVTAEDYEELSRSTPGHRVARVKALPLYSPGLKNYPENQTSAAVTVVVVPYSESPNPVPSTGFLRSVKHHLDRYRLLTTNLQVIAPEYIKVTVYAVVVINSSKGEPREKIMDMLNHFLQALDPNDPGGGWAFGRTVNKGDIYEIINRIPVVEYVKDLWLYAEGGGIKREVSGDIELPPTGLVYSGEHEIEIIHKNDV